MHTPASQTWFGAQSASKRHSPGATPQAPAVTVSDAGQAVAAAMAGMGRARVPALLVAGMVEAGMLALSSAPEPSRRAYWLVAPRPQWRQKKVQTLVAALTVG